MHTPGPGRIEPTEHSSAGCYAGAGGGGGRAVVPLRARPDRREAGIPPPRARRV